MKMRERYIDKPKIGNLSPSLAARIAFLAIDSGAAHK